MRELIDSLEKRDSADYLLDTCFLMHSFESGTKGPLIEFCKTHKTAMLSFNLEELNLKHHKLGGTANHHIREFLKLKIIKSVPIDVMPGEREKEIRYVRDFDEQILKIVRDPSDAIILVAGLKMRADILTKDKHHLFTTNAENFLNKYGIRVLNELSHAGRTP